MMLFRVGLCLLPIILMLSQAEEKLKVAVYYEALCPDSKAFIANQLYPAYSKIGSSLLIDFLPYGFSTSKVVNRTIFEFTCEHGPPECYGNKVYACMLAEENNQDKRVEYTYCAMSKGSTQVAFKECAESVGVSWDYIAKCLESGLGDRLLYLYGLKTESVRPKITVIPMVIFRGIYNETLQEASQKDFLGTACKLLESQPSECPK